jgi:hypothetical protein
MLTPAQKNKIIEDCKKLETVKQAFDYMNSEFEIENCTLGYVAKPLFIEGLIKSINLLNPKKR